MSTDSARLRAGVHSASSKRLDWYNERNIRVESATFKNLRSMDTYSLFPSTANDELQLLGSKVGNFDIMCQLEGTNSDEKWWPRWCISNDSRMKGILYFGIQFETPRNVPMEYAKVRINFGPPVSEAPIPVVDDYAPKEPVVGPPMVHQRGKNKVIAPKLGLNVGPGGGNVEGGSRETTDTSQPVRTWEFTSRRPSPSNNSSSTMSSEVEFGWERGWHDDYDGRNRRFRAAVAVSRKSTETLSMSVHVEAKPLRLWHKIRTRSAPRYKPSDLLRPVHTTSESDFRILRQDLEQKVQQDNEAKPTGMFSCDVNIFVH